MGEPGLEQCVLNAIYEASPDGIMVVDEQGIIVSHNRRFIEMARTPRTLLHGPDPGTAIGQDGAPILAAVLETVLDKPAFLARVTQLNDHPELDDFSEHEFQDGRTIERHSTVLRCPDGRLLGRVWFLRDITEQLQSAESIRTLSLYDRLTGLPNRRLLLERLHQAFNASARSGHGGAVLLIDLDNFKDINNSAGHAIGDLMLQQTAERLLSCVSPADTVAHLTADEFVVMLVDLKADVTATATQAQIAGDRIIATLEQPYFIAGQEYRCTSSIGAAVFADHTNLAEELLKRADIAMSQAKSAGRNTLRFFNPKMQEVINTRTALDADLHKALLNHEFCLYFQVQVDSTNRALGAEALIRWKHPERGMIAPAEFIAAAEDSGMILPIGQWVLETACAQLKAWERDSHTRELSLAVNVSGTQFRQADFVAQINAVVTRHGIKPSRLKLELTESMLVGDIEEVIVIMSALKQIGVRFALDDFGTGYSSLQYLMRLPIDQLKIDQSFVRDLVASKNARAIVRTIIAMARSLDLEVIAEGVETDAEKQLLLGKGCGLFQGYLFGRPVPLRQFEAELKNSWHYEPQRSWVD